jgi:hypothetical protein
MIDFKIILILLAILVLFYVRIQKERFDEVAGRKFCSQFNSDYNSCYSNGCTVFVGLNGNTFCYPRHIS